MWLNRPYVPLLAAGQKGMGIRFSDYPAIPYFYRREIPQVKKCPSREEATEHRSCPFSPGKHSSHIYICLRQTKEKGIFFEVAG